MIHAFLVEKMMLGYGVSVVVGALAERLQALGEDVVIGCIQHDDNFPHLSITRLMPSEAGVAAFLKSHQCDIVAAHTSPFFEILAALNIDIPRIAWEHGDPTPDFFHDDKKERQNIADNKRIAVYPNLEAVVAISDFIAHDIGWPNSIVIANGCDHIADLGPKTPPTTAPAALKVGTLMRLGKGEAAYKGGHLFMELVSLTQSLGSNIDFHIMGRGTPEDAAEFTKAGINVKLNATDGERLEYLRQLDVFVSFSLWEGFNLPAVEAQALGTPALILDTGAHPEVSPLVYANVRDIAIQILAYQDRRDLLSTHSNMIYNNVRRKFNWDQAAKDYLAKAIPHARHQLKHRDQRRTPPLIPPATTILQQLWRAAWAILPDRLTPYRLFVAQGMARFLMISRTHGRKAAVKRGLAKLLRIR